MLSSISDRVTEEIRKIKFQNKIVSTSATIIFPLIIALTINFNKDIIDVSTILFWTILVSFVLMQILYASALISGSPLVQEIYPEFQQLKKRASDLVGENEKYLNELLSAETHIEAVYQWMRMEHIYAQATVEQSLKEIYSELLAVVVEKREEFFGFRSGEFWNFALYLLNQESGLLEPVWREHHPKLPVSAGLGRKWPQPEGHVGLAFTQQKVQVTGDANAPEIVNIVRGNGERNLEGDANNYQSFASIPLMINDHDSPIGILVATSNSTNRFDLQNTKILRNAALIIAKVTTERNISDCFNE